MTTGNDARELDGTWMMVYGEQGGERLPETRAWRARLVVGDGAFTLRVGADTFRGAFQPAPTQGPGWADAVIAEGPRRGAMVRGVYVVVGCRLRLCFAAPGERRPTDFNSGDLVHVWELLTEVVRFPGPHPRGGR